MASITLAGVAKTYPGKDSSYILQDIGFTIGDGEFVVLVGPSGCGKSTLLRMIAGLEDISGGEIRIDGRRVNDTPPAQRGLSMVFQNYALYAHMSVYENIAFGLRLARTPRAEIDTAVRGVAKMLQLEHLLQRKPPQLSGGQRQRVAIGRAIVRKPSAFLFDEPLSNLDAALRADMRVEIARLHKQLGTTMIYVTHDQVEAMTLADRIVVLSPKGVQQIGAPMDLYDEPANIFVAGFIGSPRMNMTAGRIDDQGRLVIGDALALDWRAREGGAREVTVGIRAEHLAPDPQGPIRGSVLLVERLGAESHVHLSVPGLPQPLVVAVPGEPPRANTAWAVRPQPGRVYVFGDDGRRVAGAPALSQQPIATSEAP